LAGADSNGTSIDAFKGDRLPGYPEHMGSLDVKYFQNLSSRMSLDVLYQMTSNSDIYSRVGLRNNGESLPGFTVHNLSLALSGDRWTATLYSQNITNKFAVTGTRQDASYIRKVPDDPAGFDVRRYFHNVLRPRTIGVDIRWKFGE
jgi:hypothetical protein